MEIWIKEWEKEIWIKHWEDMDEGMRGNSRLNKRVRGKEMIGWIKKVRRYGNLSVDKRVRGNESLDKQVN